MSVKSGIRWRMTQHGAGKARYAPPPLLLLLLLLLLTSSYCTGTGALLIGAEGNGRQACCQPIRGRKIVSESSPLPHIQRTTTRIPLVFATSCVFEPHGKSGLMTGRRAWVKIPHLRFASACVSAGWGEQQHKGWRVSMSVPVFSYPSSQSTYLLESVG